MEYRSYMSVLYNLIQADLKVFKSTLIDKIIDYSIWVCVSAFVYGYILPEFGLDPDLKKLLVVGLFASAALFEIFDDVMSFVADINSERIVDFYATMPIPASVVFLRYFIFYTIKGMFVALITCVAGLLLLVNVINFYQINLMYLFIAMITSCLFYAALSLWITAMVRTIERIGSVWSRFIFPLWFLGGFQFSWYGLYAAFPNFAYLDLINPYIHVMESYRVAFLGQEGYLPFFSSIGVLTCFVLILLVHGIYRMKKYLDFV